MEPRGVSLQLRDRCPLRRGGRPLVHSPFEITRTGVQFVLNGALDRYPGARIILARHGLVPYASLR